MPAVVTQQGGAWFRLARFPPPPARLQFFKIEMLLFLILIFSKVIQTLCKTKLYVCKYIFMCVYVCTHMCVYMCFFTSLYNMGIIFFFYYGHHFNEDILDHLDECHIFLTIPSCWTLRLFLIFPFAK